MQSQIRQLINKYKQQFDVAHIKPIKHDCNTLATDYKMQLEHCCWMIKEITTMLFEANQISIGDYAEKQIVKCWRWLGFIEGVLWSQSSYPLSLLEE